MADTLGWRMKFGVMTPSTNTVVQPEYDDLRPPGVTNHVARMHIPPMAIRTEADFDESIRLIDKALEGAIDRVMTCEPGYLILGISALAVWGGTIESARQLTERIRKRAGRPIGVSHAGDALPAALKAYAGGRRIAIMDPYFPSLEEHQVCFFKEHGYEVVRVKHLRGKSPVLYAHTTVAEMTWGPCSSMLPIGIRMTGLARKACSASRQVMRHSSALAMSSLLVEVLDSTQREWPSA